MVMGITVTSVDIIGVGATTVNESNNTLRDMDAYMMAKSTMIPEDKAAIEMISLFAIIKWVARCAQPSINHVFVQESFAGIVIADGA